MKTKNFFKNFFYILKYIFILYLVNITVGILQYVTDIKNNDLGVFIALISTLFIYYILLKKEKKNLFRYVKINKIKITSRSILLILVFSISYFCIYTSLNNISLKTSQGTEILHANLNILAIFHLILLAPLIEEILFRGIIFLKLKESVNVYTAIIVQGLIFGFLHGAVSGYIAQSLLATLSGIVFCYIYYKTDNLTFPIILHIIYNLLVLIFQTLMTNTNIVILLSIGIIGLTLSYFLYKK